MRDAPSRTAEVVCYMRATDQRRTADARIIDDPHARLFLGPMLRTALATLEVTGKLGQKTEQLFPGLTTYIIARHRFIDDQLLSALEAGTVDQLVLLGAGYDTRAFRFTERLAGRPVFEVDHPSTGQRKARIVHNNRAKLPVVDVQTVAIDFQTQSIDERLLDAGFDPDARTFFVWEGVSMYLTRKAVKETLRAVHRIAAPGSEFTMDSWYLLDAPNLVATAHRLSSNLLHFLGEPVTFGIHPEDMQYFLERLGYNLTDLADAAELERRYVRDGRKVYAANYVLSAEVKS